MTSAVRGKVGNLPWELTSFVGRRHEVAEVKRLLAESRLVTLTGIGGVGKTRLALHVAEQLSRAFDGGVWLVELGELRDPDLVADVVVTALGLSEHRTRSAADLLVDFLQDRHLLLVLDNCEQVVDGVALLTASLLRASRRLQVLATSREPLAILGETVFRVPPLTVPDPERPRTSPGLPNNEAVRLFAERARSAVPGFELTEQNQQSVAAVCRRLEGLPLAIELAAARLRALSVDQVLRSLADRFRLLTANSREAPTRQQTLRLCVDWSATLLTGDERELWGRLAVFAGGFELDAAEATCAGDLDPVEFVDAVSSLVDKSILIRDEADGTVRYRLLETLSEYGRELLHEAGEYDELRRRHRDWYEGLAVRSEREWIGPAQLGLISRLRRERSNLRRALEFGTSRPDAVGPGLRTATALYEFAVATGQLIEGKYWLDRLLACPPGDASVEDRALALCADARFTALHGDFPEARGLIERARAVAGPTPDRLIAARLDLAEGITDCYSGAPDLAVGHLERALSWFRGEGDLLHQTATLTVLGVAHTLAGRPADGADVFDQVLRLGAAHGESKYRSYALSALGLARAGLSDFAGAREAVEQSLRICHATGDPLTASACLKTLSWIAAELHEDERAAVLMGAASTVGESVGRPAVIAQDMLGRHEETLRRVRRTLGRSGFAAAFRRGHQFGADAAVAYALDEQHPASEDRPAVGEGAGVAALTRRERQVAELVAQGMTNRSIAERLVISQRTVDGHVEHVLNKLGFTARAQIAAWVAEQGARDTGGTR
ncbi:LuxR family transcriptional regulator [Rhodococcus sp. D2-41]|uniref:LuxR C-terminal-related transcriptional regulator n=1 Tax=Speluncibacter jeojiensis TaxID=2710754 RepID=A0A9X4M1C0_9ACTN|nr:LuxR C-terminal-related transcriptional regulator [Rhodococcus sp. D2-41]MDG3011673.1 LuxR family transcriptional regulator [Rhodococcus sp. D2-41]MDG3014972.1 LuxR C-terminal-related transcriptional regulator [Corynebacteriales bacterium D3-21]